MITRRDLLFLNSAKQFLNAKGLADLNISLSFSSSLALRPDSRLENVVCERSTNARVQSPMIMFRIFLPVRLMIKRHL